MTHMNVESLTWDSSFFGYNVGKIILTDLCIDTNLLQKKAVGFQLIYLFSPVRIIEFENYLVDEKILLEMNCTNDHIENETFQLELFDPNKHDFNALRNLAISSGEYSRFKIDSNFKNNEFVELYSRWITQSVEGKSAFEVVVATNQDDEILGFITLVKKEKLLEIGLIAVAEKARGKGIAKLLLNYTNEKAMSLNISKIQVTTQGKNIPAMHLYQSFGFKIKNITYIYHYWNI